MAPKPVVQSASNPIVKRVRAARAGKPEPALFLEGDRLVDDARGAGVAFELLLVAADREERAAELEAVGCEVTLVAPELLERLSELVSSPGILGVARPPASAPLDALLAPGGEVPGGATAGAALLLVVAGVSDPGNLGALIRAAEAAGARGVALVRGGASPWNSKALRGSMGSALRLPVHFAEEADALARELAERGVRQVRAATRGGRAPSSFDWSGDVALWIGAETGTLPAAAESFEAISIPMAGAAESLNVTTAAAVLLFAAGRAEARP